MNSKGFLSMMVALAAIALMALTFLTFQSNISTQQALSIQEAALEVRTTWTNVRYLLDKAVGTAMYNNVKNSSCIVPLQFSSLENSLPPSVLNALKSCEIMLFPPAVSNKVQFSFDLKCSKEISGSTVELVSAVTLQKTVTSNNDPSNCKVNVFDEQSQQFDIEEIFP